MIENVIIENEESKIFINSLKNYDLNSIRTLLDDGNREIWKYISDNTNKETVLHMAINTNDNSLINPILFYCKSKLNEEELKIFINAKNNKGTTALHYACFYGNIETIKNLIQFGADITAETEKGLNVLHYAAQGNQPNSLVYLYLFHRDSIFLEKADIGGSTPLHWASFSLSMEMVLYLINYNVNIDEQDKKGNTPLHLAVIKRSYKMVQKLLQKGALSSIKNKLNQLPKDIAKQKKEKKIYNLLLKNEKHQFCNIKAPTQKKSKSKRNLIIVFIFQFITFLIICFCMFPQIIVNFKLNNNSAQKIGYYFFLIFYIVYTVAFLIIFIKLIIIDPGRPIGFSMNYLKDLFSKNKITINLFEYCPKCLVKISKTTKHCVICDECCEGFDHHCYWVNNCVGKNNYNYFISFLVFAFLDMINLLFISIYSIYSLFKYDNESENSAEDIRENCRNNLFNSFANFTFFFECFYFDIFGLKLTFNVFLILSILFFLIPEVLLLCLHLKNAMKKLKQKKLINNSNESNVPDLLLNDN